MLSPATEWISLIAALPEPAAVLAGKSAVVEAVNPTFARLLDRAAEDLVGKELARLVDAADRLALDRAIGTPEAQTVEIRVAMRTGGDVTLALSLGEAMASGQRLILAREVRPEERSQRQLLQYFRDVIDSVGPLVAIFDADDRMIAYNRNYREGYRVGDRDLPPHVRLEGKTYRECMELRAKYQLHREHLDQPWKFVEERMRQHQQETAQTITLAHGQTLKVEKHTLPDGVRVIVGTDITAIAEGERHRQDLEAQLHHSQKLEALGTLAGGITHDLNNTLVPIVALSKAMAGRMPLGSRERASIDLIMQAADRARDLVGRILAFSRKQAVEHKPVDLGDVVVQGMKLLRSLVPTTIDLVTELAPVPEVIGDSGQCYQILLNLVSNAARAIGAAPGAITVRLRSDNAAGAVMLAVEDNGCGMDETTRRRIFEPFYTTRKTGEGTGLGLSVVHGIVTSYGGRIDVKSSPGGGTTFTIHLPQARAIAAQEAPAA
jgi:signal transduction histidine kinase